MPKECAILKCRGKRFVNQEKSTIQTDVIYTETKSNQTAQQVKPAQKLMDIKLPNNDVFAEDITTKIPMFDIGASNSQRDGQT